MQPPAVFQVLHGTAQACQQRTQGGPACVPASIPDTLIEGHSGTLQAILTKAESQLLALSSEVPNCLIQVVPTCQPALEGATASWQVQGCTAQHSLVCQARGPQLGPHCVCPCTYRWPHWSHFPDPCPTEFHPPKCWTVYKGGIRGSEVVAQLGTPSSGRRFRERQTSGTHQTHPARCWKCRIR